MPRLIGATPTRVGQDGSVNELKERLRADLTDAMRARDQVRLRPLRMALTSITNEEVSGNAVHELSDDQILKVLTREAKKRREAAEAFDAGRRARPRARPRGPGRGGAGGGRGTGRVPSGPALRRGPDGAGRGGRGRDRRQRHAGH